MVDRDQRTNLKSMFGVGSITANENVHVLMNKNVKQITSTTLTSSMSMMTTNTNILGSVNGSGINQAMRNALGDIGNRIGGSNTEMNIGLKKNDIKPITIVPPAPPPQEQMIDLITDDSSIMEVSPNDESVIDIDEMDSENSQLASEYVKDIYKYLTHMERQFRVSPTFLEEKIVTSKMRSVLVDWLIQVHNKFHLLQETLYLCIQILDEYLQVNNVEKMKLQLVGVTAMFLASKYEEMYVPAIDDFVYMTDNTYTKCEIRKMEIDILKALSFMLGKPLPLHFLRRFSKAGQATPKQHTLAKYFMELTLHDAEFSSFDPSYLAACALCLSFKLLNGCEWDRTMEFYTTYKINQLMPGMQKIARLVKKASENEYRFKAATNKYVTSRNIRIALTPELSGDTMADIIKGVYS